MGFVGLFWKNNLQEAYLPKLSISGLGVGLKIKKREKTPYKPF